MPRFASIHAFPAAAPMPKSVHQTQSAPCDAEQPYKRRSVTAATLYSVDTILHKINSIDNDKWFLLNRLSEDARGAEPGPVRDLLMRINALERKRLEEMLDARRDKVAELGRLRDRLDSERSDA